MDFVDHFVIIREISFKTEAILYPSNISQGITTQLRMIYND